MIGINNIIDTIRQHLKPYLLKPEYIEANKLNPLYGHCYIATEALYYLIRYYKLKNYYHYQPYFGYTPDNITHWWLQAHNADNKIIDITKNQFILLGYPPPYITGKHRFFLTNKPSKRSYILMKNVIFSISILFPV
jgi:hypothetical protein